MHREGTEGRRGDPAFDAARFRSRDGPSSSGLRGVKGSRPRTKAQLLAGYRAQLREYRSLQARPTTHRRVQSAATRIPDALPLLSATPQGASLQHHEGLHETSCDLGCDV